jgi:hypothetical protein
MAFINENRTRYYGLGVGDIVSVKCISGKHTVIELSPMDNNAVFLEGPEKVPFEYVAEWCNIITKVEYINK